jgi:hypothetical protein
METTIAGIDVHKKVLMVVVVSRGAGEAKAGARKRFGATASELSRLRLWLQEQGVGEAVMARRSTGGQCGWNWSRA